MNKFKYLPGQRWLAICDTIHTVYKFVIEITRENGIYGKIITHIQYHWEFDSGKEIHFDRKKPDAPLYKNSNWTYIYLLGQDKE